MPCPYSFTSGAPLIATVLPDSGELEGYSTIILPLTLSAHAQRVSGIRFFLRVLFLFVYFKSTSPHTLVQYQVLNGLMT